MSANCCGVLELPKSFFNRTESLYYTQGFFHGVLGTRFGSLESEKIIIGSLQIQTGFLTFSLKSPAIMAVEVTAITGLAPAQHGV